MLPALRRFHPCLSGWFPFVVADTGEQQLLELRLSEVLDPLLGKSRITGGYCPMPNEISPLPAMEQAGRQGTILAYPAFSDHQSEIRFLAGEPAEPGPWSCFQPLLDSPEVFPDLVLVPLVAIDGHGTRLGQGKGHYDRVPPDLKRAGALLIGLGWDVQKLDAALEPEMWDVPMDGFCSPSGLEMWR